MRTLLAEVVMVIVSCLALISNSIAAAGSMKAPGKFTNVKLLVKKGDKIKEADVSLIFERQRLVIRSEELGVHMKVFPYGEVLNADYSYSSHPRYKSGPAGVLALPVFFMKGKKHWLSIKTIKDYAVLRLDKNNFQTIITAFETHTRKKVELLGEEK